MESLPVVARMVTAHEIGHVLGINVHDESCPWMRPSMPLNAVLVDAPCTGLGTLPVISCHSCRVPASFDSTMASAPGPT